MGVVTPWKAPIPLDEVTGGDVREIQERIGDLGVYREDSQAKEWAGKVVADVLGWDASDKDTKKRIKELIKGWLKPESGELRTVWGEDNEYKKRKFIVSGPRFDLK